jgi:hypothetical protein
MSLERRMYQGISQASRRQELDRDTWAGLDRIEYKFRMVGEGGAITEPFMFGQAFDAPPQPTFSVVAPGLATKGIFNCDNEVKYDQELLSDPTFDKLRVQIPSATRRPAQWSLISHGFEEVVPHNFHYEDEQQVEFWEGGVHLDSRFDVLYPDVPHHSVSYILDTRNWDGTRWLLQPDSELAGVTFESGWGLHNTITDTTFFFKFGMDTLHLFTQYACVPSAGYQSEDIFIPMTGRCNPGDLITVTMWGWMTYLGTWWMTLRGFDAEGNHVHTDAPIAGGLGAETLVQQTETREEHHYTFEVPAPGESIDVVWFRIDCGHNFTGQTTATDHVYLDRVGVTIAKGPYSYEPLPAVYATIGVSEWIRDEQGMYVGAYLWCRAGGTNPDPVDVQSDATVTFRGRVLKSYANIHPVEPRSAPIEVVLQVPA